MKISLCMIVRNEQKFIKRCLDNALTLVDEAIIIDTGSTDNTKNIIREYGNKIKLIEANWENDFSKARNIYLENATGDWILVLDGDEEIACNRESLVDFILHTQVEAFNIRWINILDNQEKLNSWAYCRLFRNKGYRYYRPVHEQLNIDRDKIKILDEDICTIFHYGYLSENIQSKDKIKRNLDILIKDYEENREDSFTCYHIGATYAASGDYKRALDFFKKSYEFGIKYGFGGYYFELVKRLSEVILLLRDYRLCVDFINQLLVDDKVKRFTDLYYIIGNAYYNLKDYKHSLESFNKCLDIGDTKKFPSVLGRGTYLSLMMMGKIYKELNQNELVFDCYMKAYKFKDNLDIKDIKEIEEYIEKKDDNMNEINRHVAEVKTNIQKLINENKILEAKELLLDYEKMAKDDIEIYSIKAIICIMENKLDEAETILKQGLSMDMNNSDLLFNLAYIYENKTLYTKAYKYYLQAKNNSKGREFRNNIDFILENLEKNYDIEIDKNLCETNRKTSIVILTYNKLEYTKLCIDSIRKYTQKGTYEIVVVDNNSTDDTRDWLKKQKDIKLILNNENFGFPGGCNVGIKASEKENDILLLNNDIIVTPNWLNNLIKCLYSDEYIGAVGSVSNSCSNYQAIKVNYKSIEDMITFAENYNVSDSTKWEQKVRLIGYCMLIKRSVIDKIGLLDENFFPGNFEDDDISYRIQQEGYKLYLCNDTFIHHFGSTSFKENLEKFNQLLRTNSQKFMDKWGFNSETNSMVYLNMLQKLDNNKDSFSVLHIGCGTGATLLKIKYMFKNAKLFGVDSNPVTARFTSNFAEAKVASIDESLKFPDNYFDYILVTNSIEYSNLPKEALKRIGRLLKEGGKLFIFIKNSNYYEEIIKLLIGSVNSEEKNLYRYYNYNEIDELIPKEIFCNINVEQQINSINPDSDKIIEYICKLSGNNMKNQYITKEYLISCEKISEVKKEIEYRGNRNKFIEEYSKDTFPLVSVLIPTYNRPEYLRIALESVLNQTYKNIEIIIGDDSTNDDTKKLIMENYINEFNNIRYYHNEKNLGQFDNDLKLLSMAQGEFINYLMDDDLFEATKIEKMMNYFIHDNNEEISFVTSHRFVIDSEGKIKGIFGNTNDIFKQDTVIDGIELGNFILKNNFNCIGEPTTVLFRKNKLKEPFGVYNGRRYGCNVDQAAWFSLLSEGKAVFINETLSSFRFHDDQQLGSNRMKILGAMDYAHEVLTAREKGFLFNKEEFSQALNTSFSYCEFIITSLNQLEKDEQYITDFTELKELCEKLKIQLEAILTINKNDNEELNLVENISDKPKTYDVQELKFLLRRIENDIETEKSKSRVIELIKENLVGCEKIIKVVDRDIIKKEEILNTVAVNCYENALYESIIPLLQRAYEIDNKNRETVYNLAYVLHVVGQDAMALKYLEGLVEQDEDIKELINEIKGVSYNEQ